ncbi:protein NYNRIN-like [Aphis craccivora]|uniref:RNA-directed DNA polymerase n=1 Tax=Aphis craccivora TaxID=307492 RepID=A0A6G0Y139_APHCR|nr:protein NYNRIN-like [Aphis craccivora]
MHRDLLLVRETHIHFGHVGAYKTYHILRDNYHFRNMYNRIKNSPNPVNYVKKAKGSTISTIPAEPKCTIPLDLMGLLPRGQLGMRYILTLVDIFSKHVRLYAIRRVNTDTIFHKLTHDYLPKHGPIKKILTDNGTQFTSSKWTEQLQFISLPTNEQTTDVNIIIELAKSRLQKRADQRNRIKDQKKKFPTYQMGQQVLVKEHKLSSGTDKEIHKFFLLYRGPYTISQVHENNTLIITDD